MTPINTTALAALCEEALADDKATTPGPWFTRGSQVSTTAIGPASIGVMRDGCAEFIANARTREPRLASALAALLPLVPALDELEAARIALGEWVASIPPESVELHRRIGLAIGAVRAEWQTARAKLGEVGL